MMKRTSPLFLKILRVSAYAATVSLLLGVCAARQVYADVKESALAMGSELEKIGDIAGSKNRVRVNGELVNVASTQIAKPVSQVLDLFEKDCRNHSGGLIEEFAQLRKIQSKVEVPDISKGPLGLGILRAEKNESGFVACLSQKGDGGSKGILERLNEFLATGDLSKMGDVRYVVARRGDNGMSHVVVAWTDGPFQVGKMFPKEGDAPGTDVVGASRPEGAKRLLTLSIDGAPYGLRVYDTTESLQTVLKGYDTTMPKLGWKPIELIQAAKMPEKATARAFSRESGELLVFAAPDEDGDGSIISVVETPARR